MGATILRNFPHVPSRIDIPSDEEAIAELRCKMAEEVIIGSGNTLTFDHSKCKADSTMV